MDDVQGVVLTSGFVKGSASGAARAAPAAVLVGAVVVIPALILGSYAFRETTFLGAGPGPTLDQFRGLAQHPTFWTLTGRTIGIGLVVGVVVTALAFTMAYGIRFRFSTRSGRRLLAVVIAAGVASFLVRIFAWATILNGNGLVNRVLSALGITSEPVESLFYSPFAVVVTMSYLYLPIGIVIMHGALQGVDAHSLEAGRDLGAGRWRTALQAVAPQVRNAITTCFVLTTVLAAADYVTPQLVGGTAGITVGVEIRDRAITGGDLPGAAATTIAFLLALAVALLCTFIALQCIRLLARPMSPTANRVALRLSRLAPRRLQRVSFSRAAAIVLAGYLLLPTLVVLVFSFNSARTLGLPWKGFTLDWYPEVIARPGFASSLQTSLTIALIASLGATVVGGAMASAAARSGPRTRGIIQAVALLPFVVPGILVGLGLLVVADASPLAPGMGLTLVAHVALLLPIVVAVVVGRLLTLNPEFRQAARDLGAGPATAFRTVTLPLVLPSLLAGFVLCFAISMDEVFVTAFTIGSGTTLPIWILSQARVGFDPGLNALGVMLVAGTVVIPLLVYGIGRAALWLFGRRLPTHAEGAN